MEDTTNKIANLCEGYRLTNSLFDSLNAHKDKLSDMYCSVKYYAELTEKLRQYIAWEVKDQFAMEFVSSGLKKGALIRLVAEMRRNLALYEHDKEVYSRISMSALYEQYVNDLPPQQKTTPIPQAAFGANPFPVLHADTRNFLDTLEEYVGELPIGPEIQQSQNNKVYFDRAFLDKVHEVCCGKQFKDILQADFYDNINTMAIQAKLEINGREKARVYYLIRLLYERNKEDDRAEWLSRILAHLGLSKEVYLRKNRTAAESSDQKSEKFRTEIHEVFGIKGT